jgi:hypothetical protein
MQPLVPRSSSSRSWVCCGPPARLSAHPARPYHTAVGANAGCVSLGLSISTGAGRQAPDRASASRMSSAQAVTKVSGSPFRGARRAATSASAFGRRKAASCAVLSAATSAGTSDRASSQTAAAPAALPHSPSPAAPRVHTVGRAGLEASRSLAPQPWVRSVPWAPQPEPHRVLRRARTVEGGVAAGRLDWSAGVRGGGPQ